MGAAREPGNEEKGHGCLTEAELDLIDTTDKIKARYILVALGMSGIAILYSLRVNLSVAIVSMVNNTAISSSSSSSDNATYGEDTCPPAGGADVVYREDGSFVWDEEMQGMMLAGFFYGYTVGQVPGGLLAERFGGKLVFGLGALVPAILTVVSPFTAWVNEYFFFAMRILEGLVEGVTFPAIQLMISKWAPPQERSRFSIIYSGGYLGTVITMALSGVMCDSEVGWPLVFYVFGGLGVLWSIPWFLLAYDTPAKHPRIDPAERRFIEASLGKVPAKRKLPIPWKKLLSTPGLWGCASMHFGIGWTFFALLTCGPTYLANILHFNISSNAALSAIPYIMGGSASVVFSWILDYLISNKIVSKMNGYRIFNGITNVGPALTLLIITAVGCDHVAILVLLAINGLCLGAQYTSNSINLLGIAPNFAGTMLGISNTFANAAGILAPYAVGWITSGNQTRTAWNTVFYVSAGIGVATYLIWLVLGTDKVQPWNDPPPEAVPKDADKPDDHASVFGKGVDDKGFNGEY
ncbi:sialin-like isoform X1 [Schistocerca gregaria]|uniref:sialin-like isoform X1 n=1 Tax=Schistocerca gregaria TaxID=7010 RepID=UPI00211EB9D1|nr:sialin-like isoform X1 [Schistocerca gregaria]XP_049859696.1 sialin-like isoform X1 [Schistocerca gregaria]